MNCPASLTRRLALACSLLSLLGVGLKADDPAPNRGQARFEERFLTDMIEHHQEGVQLANLAITRATHEDLKELAASIKTNQTLEIAKLQTWLEEWYGVTSEVTAPELRGSAKRDVDELSALSGEEFEKEFMVALSLHHADALKAASEGVVHAYHADLIDFSRLVLDMQSDEIALLRIWLNQWYEITDVTWSAVTPSDSTSIINNRVPTPTPAPATPGTNTDSTVPSNTTTTPANTAPTTVTTTPGTNATTTITTPPLTTN